MLSQPLTVAKTCCSLYLAYNPLNSSLKELLLAHQTFTIWNPSVIPNSYLHSSVLLGPYVYLCTMIINSQIEL